MMREKEPLKQKAENMAILPMREDPMTEEEKCLTERKELSRSVKMKSNENIAGRKVEEQGEAGPAGESLTFSPLS